MPFRDPLTVEQLKALKVRAEGDPDKIAMLWEIARLRSLVMTGAQFHFDTPMPYGAMQPIWINLCKAYEAEPCVVDWRRL